MTAGEEPGGQGVGRTKLNNGDVGQSSAPARDAHRSRNVSRGRFRGFTLAEVLITLAIIGVVAAMTIPSVIVRTNQQEYKTGAKKALAMMTQAIKLTEDDLGLPLDYYGTSMDSEEQEEFFNALVKNMYVIKTEVDPDGRHTMYTTDGFRYHMSGNSSRIVKFYVDVNGDKEPTKGGLPQEEWVQAKCKDKDKTHLDEPEWPNVVLSDIFVIEIGAGSATVKPFDE